MPRADRWLAQELSPLGGVSVTEARMKHGIGLHVAGKRPQDSPRLRGLNWTNRRQTCMQKLPHGPLHSQAIIARKAPALRPQFDCSKM